MTGVQTCALPISPGQVVTVIGDASNNARVVDMDWTGAAFNPTLAGALAQNLRIHGSLILGTGMNVTFSGPIYFESTETGQVVTSAGVALGSINHMYFQGEGGGWTLTDGLNIGSKTLYLVYGSLNTNNQNITAGIFNSNYSGNVRSLNLGSSEIILSSTSDQALRFHPTAMTFNAGTSLIRFTGASSGIYNVSGSGLLFNDVIFEAVTGTNNVYNDNGQFNSLTFNSNGNVNYSNTINTLTVAGNSTIGSNNNNFNTVVIGGNVTINGNTNTFGHFTMNGNGTVTQNNTFGTLLLTAGKQYTFTNGKTQTFLNDLIAEGTETELIVIKSSVPGSPATFSKTSGAVEVNYVSLQDNAATGGATFTAYNSVDLGGNSGWTILSAGSKDYYWIGGTGNWNDASKWSLTSGGPGGTGLPTANDNVFFDANSFTAPGQVVTIIGDVSNNARVVNMDWTGAAFNPTLAGASSQNLRISGSLTLIPGMSVTFAGTIYLEATETGKLVTTAGVSLGAINNLYFQGEGGGWTLMDGLNIGGKFLYLVRGSLNTNNQPVTAGIFNSDYSGNVRSLTLGSSEITLSSTSDQSLRFHPTGMTFDAGTSLIRFTGAGAGIYNVSGSGLFFYDVIFEAATGNVDVYNNGGFNNLVFQSTGTSNLRYSNTVNTVTFAGTGGIHDNNTIGYAKFNGSGTITGNNTFETLEFTPGYTYTLTNSRTQIITNDLIAHGTCPSPITIQSNSITVRTTIQKSSGTITINQVSIQGLNATGGATFIANNAIDLGNNLGWTINPVGIQNLYWVGGTGNWNDVSHWSDVSGGAGGYCLPTQLDNVIFDQNSFNQNGQAVYVDIASASCRDMDWSAVTFVPTFTANSNTFNLNISGSLTLSPDMNFAFSGPVNFVGEAPAKSTWEITMAGRNFNNAVYFNGDGGIWTLMDNLTISSNDLFLNKGTLNTNDKTLSIRRFYSDNNNVRTLNLGSSVINIGSNQSLAWYVTGSNFTINPGTSEIRFSAANGSLYSLGASNLTYHNIVFQNPGGTSILRSDDQINNITFQPAGKVWGDGAFNNVIFYGNGEIDGNNSFGDVTFFNNALILGSNSFSNLTLSPGKLCQMQAGQTQTIANNLTFWGNVDNPITLQSATAGSQAVISKAAGTVSGNYILLKDMFAAGGATFNVYNSTDLGNNDNWNFLEPPFATCPEDFSVCINVAPFELNQALPAGWDYSGEGVSFDNGVYMFNPALVNGNQSVVTYTIGGLFPGSCYFAINILPLPVVNCRPDIEVCEDSDYITLYEGVGQYYYNNQPITGFNPVDPGIFPIIFEGSNSCGTATCTFDITVHAKPEVIISGELGFCEGESTVLTASAGSSYLWNTGETTQSITVTIAGDYSVNVTNEFDCVGNAGVTTYYLPVTVPTCPADMSLLITDPPVTLTGALPEGGAYSGTGVSGNVFNPSTAGIGNFLITYTYDDVCGNQICEFTIHVSGVSSLTCVGNQTVITNTGNCTYLHSGTDWDAIGVNNCFSDEIISKFDLTAEGWLLDSPSDPGSTLAWLATGGNPGGYVRITDAAQSTVDRFSAPALFLGNKSGFYGGTFKFDIRHSINITSTGNEKLVFTGNGLSIHYITPFPNTTWQTWTIPIIAGDWRISGGNVIATEAQIRSVMSNLEKITILADWRSGTETTSIDNVQMTPGPAYYVLSGATTGTGTSLNGIAFNPGSTLVSWYFMDGCANAFTCSFTVDIPVFEATITPGGATTLCPGDQLILTATEGVSYLWNTNESTQSIVVTEAGDYSVVVTNASGCEASASITVTMQVLTIPTCPEDIYVIVTDSPFSLTGGLPEGGTYSGAGVTAGIFNPSIGVGNYPITYTIDDVCGPQSCEFMIYVSEEPITCLDATISNFPADVDDVCYDESYSVDFSGVVIENAIEVIWTVIPAEAGFVENNVFELNPGILGDVTVQLLAIAEDPCQDAQASVGFTVKPLPGYFCDLSETEICSGEEVTFTHNFEGVAPWTLEYYLGGVLMSFTTSENPYVVTQTFTQTTYFEPVHIYSGNGCEEGVSQFTIIEVSPLPSYTYEISSTEICLGEETVYTNYFTGTAPWTVDFYYNGDLMSFTTSDNPQTYTETLTQTTLYQPFMVTDGKGCSQIVNQPTTIQVNPLPTFSYEVSDTELCYGEELTWTEYFTGTPPWTVNYLNNGEPGFFIAYNNPEIFTEVVTESAFFVPQTVTDGNGCVSTVNQPITITVNPLPTFTRDISDTEICSGDQVTITDYFTGEAPWTMTILKNGETFSFPVEESPAVRVMTLTETLTYEIVSVTDNNGCILEVNELVNIIVHPLPSVSITGELAFCEGQSTILTATEGASYDWSTGESTRSITVTMAGLYSVTVTDGNGCEGYAEATTTYLPITIPTCPDNMYVIVTEPPITLSGGLPTGGTYSGAGVTNGIFDPSVGVGNYPITYTIDDVCGPQSCEFMIYVSEEPITCLDAVISNFPATAEDACENEAYTIDFSGVVIQNAVEVIWTVVPEEAGSVVGNLFILNAGYVGNVIIAVLAVAEDPCDYAYANVEFTVNPLPSFTFEISDSEVCYGDEVTFTDQFTGTAPWTVSLIKNGTPLTFVSEEILLIHTEIMTQTTVYEILSVTDGTGCVNPINQTITIVVNPLPTFTYELSATELCYGEELIWTEYFTGTPPWRVDFLFNGEPDFFISYNNPEIYTEIVTESVTFEPLTVTDGNGCIGSVNQPVTITVNPLPTFTREISDTEICSGDEVTITDYFTGAAPWTVTILKEGETFSFPVEESPAVRVMTLTETLTYEIVSVADNNGCVLDVNELVNIIVHPLPSVDITGELAFCEGQSTVLTATEGASYDWSTGESTQSITVTVAGLYSVVVTDVHGCEGYAEVITSYLPVTIPTCPEDIYVLLTDEPFALAGGLPGGGNYSGAGVTNGIFDPSVGVGNYPVTYLIEDVCGPQSCEFMIYVSEEPVTCLDAVISNFPATAADACENEEYTIDFSGVVIQNAIEAIWSVTPVEAGAVVVNLFTLNPGYVGEVTINLLAMAEDPCDDAQASIGFTVNPLPTFTREISDTEICSGDEVTITDYFTGAAPWTVTILKEGETFSFPVEESPAVRVMTLTETLTYEIVSVTDNNGCTLEVNELVNITVHPLPTFTRDISDTEICAGEEVTITDYFTGAAPWTVTILKEGETFSFHVEESPAVRVMTLTETLTYEIVSVTDNNGCILEVNELVNITVHPLPTFVFETSDTEVCAGEEVTFINHFTGSAPWTVSYLYNGVADSFTTSENPEYFTTTFSETTHYEPLSVTDGNGCSSAVNQSVTILVNPLPTFTTELSATEICYGETVDFVNHFTGTAPWTVVYAYNGVQSSFTTSDNPDYYSEAYFETTVNEIISVTDGNGCTTYYTGNITTITVNPLPDVGITGELQFCQGESTILTATEGASYDWSTGETTQSITVTMAGLYSVVVTDENGCDGSAEVEVTVWDLPTFVFEVDQTEICEGEPVVFTNHFTGTAPWTVEYSYNGIPDTFTTSDNPEYYTEYFTETTIYQLISVTDGNGCTAYLDQSATITVIPAPEVTCPGAQTAFVTDGQVLLNLATPEGGVYSGTGVTFDGSGYYFDPSVGIGNYVITYCYQNPATGCQDCCTFNYSVVPVPGDQQVICMPAGWTGISSYYVPDNPQLETIFAQLNTDNKMVIMLAENGIYWPSQNINTLGGWDVYKGYKIKMNAFGCIEIEGEMPENKSFTVKKGSSFIPVLCDENVPAAEIFGPLGNDLLFAFDLHSQKLYWPQGGILTLDVLEPGKGYLVKMLQQRQITYNCAKSSVAGYTPAQPPVYENAPWSYNPSDVAHFISISPTALNDLETGDFIGVFNSDGTCAGFAQYNGEKSNLLLVAYGDDFTTGAVDGLTDHEAMTFRIFRPSAMTEMAAEVVFDATMPDAGIYAEQGQSKIISIKAGATSISESKLSSIGLHPNPSNGLITLTLPIVSENLNIEVTGSTGQLVHSDKLDSAITIYQLDLTKLKPGVYFIRITGNGQTEVRKIVIQ